MKLSIFKQTLVSLFVILLSASPATAEPNNLKKNQKTDYPNYYEAPTMSEQIPSHNYTAPTLSRSLFEEDPKRKLRKSDFLQEIKYSAYHLTRGEAEQIFTFADKNRDDLLEQDEWDDLAALYIYPFEACDKNKQYTLNEAEFKSCWESDPKTSFIDFRRRFQDKKYEIMMDSISTRGRSEINFSDYLLLKRALYGWEQCHTGRKYIATSQFKCAIRTAIPPKYNLKLDYEKIYRTGIRLSNDPGLIELDFTGYLRILHHAYVFTLYGAPYNSPYLDKEQFIKAVREDRYPTNFEESEIALLYDLTNTNPHQDIREMSFETFSFFFNLHRLFNKYSLTRPLQVTQEEIEKLLDDPLSPLEVTLAIDISKTDIPQSEYMEGSLVLQRLRRNERGFYNSFLETRQDASETTTSFHIDKTKFATFFESKANPAARRTFFGIFLGVDKKHWSKEMFYRAFLLSNLFVSLDWNKRFVVSTTYVLDNMNNVYDMANPPLGLKLRKNYVIYKSMPNEYHLDLLTFLALENFLWKKDIHMLSNYRRLHETTLRNILNDYGMKNMPDTVIDRSRNGYDSLRRREFDPISSIKNIITVHAAAAENMRTAEIQVENKLQVNKDDTRKYPNFHRRFQSSPHV